MSFFGESPWIGQALAQTLGGSLRATVLCIYLTLAFTLMITVFHHHCLRQKSRTIGTMILYFLLVFTFFFVVPCVLILFLGPQPFSVLKSIGLSLGNAKQGILLTLLAFPLALLAGFVGSRNPELARFYPLAPSACNRIRHFIGYETAYFLFYYTAWEFMYRGLLFFPLIPAIGVLPALCLQTIISTIHHLGHPTTEIASALPAGFVFGWIAYVTGSIVYSTVIHATIGVSTDAFICRQRRQGISRS